MGHDEEADAHRARVRANADYHVEQQRLRRQRESDRAAAILTDFVRDAAVVGIPPTELKVTPSRGPGPYRTGVSGWYLRRDRTIGVGEDGSWYVLTAPPSLLAWLRGWRLQAQPAPLQVGEGARDGESIALTRLLELRLQAGQRHP